MKTAAAALLVVASMTAQAAEPETLTLACEGTKTWKIIDGTYQKPAPEPISPGIIVNFTKRTVQLGTEAYPYPMMTGTETTIEFYERIDLGPTVMKTEGSIDRVTGALSATFTEWDKTTQHKRNWKEYVLKCRPAQRMF